jgi:hypothetical protein
MIEGFGEHVLVGALRITVHGARMPIGVIEGLHPRTPPGAPGPPATTAGDPVFAGPTAQASRSLR